MIFNTYLAVLALLGTSALASPLNARGDASPTTSPTATATATATATGTATNTDNNIGTNTGTGTNTDTNTSASSPTTTATTTAGGDITPANPLHTSLATQADPLQTSGPTQDTPSLPNCAKEAVRGYVKLFADTNTWVQAADNSYQGGTQDAQAPWSNWFFYKNQFDTGPEAMEVFDVFTYQDGKKGDKPLYRCTLNRPVQGGGDLKSCQEYRITTSKSALEVGPIKCTVSS